MSLFQAFGQKGLAALASTLENIGNIVAPVPEDEQDDGEPKQRRNEGNDDQDGEEDTFENRIHSFINARRLEIDDPPSVDPQQSPNGSLIDIDLNDDDSDVSSVDNSFQNYSKAKEVYSPSSTSSASSGVFLSNNELEKRVQMKYRESLEAEIASFNTKLREAEVRSQQNISRIQHDCDYWKDVAEAQRSEIAKLKAILDETPAPVEENSELALQYEECRQSNEQLTHRLTQSESELKSLNDAFNARNNEISRLQSDHSALMGQYSALKQLQESSLNSSESSSTSALLEIQTQLDMKTSEVVQLQSALQNTQQVHSECASLLNEEKAKVQVLEGQVSQLETQLREKEAWLQSESQRWNDALSQSEAALKDAETVAWTSKAETSEILFAMQLAESKAADLLQEVEALKRQVTELTTENVQLRSRNNDEYDAVLSREHALSSELKDLQQIAGFLRSQLNESQAEVDRLTAVSVDQQGQLNAAQTELREKTAVLNDTKKALSDAELMIASVKAEAHSTLASSESEHHQHDEFVAALNAEIQSLKAAYEQLSSDSSAQIEKETCQRLAIEEQLSSQLAAAQSETSRLQSQVVGLTAQLETAQSGLSEDSAKLNQILESGRRREADLEDQMGQLKASIEEQRHLMEKEQAASNQKNQLQEAELDRIRSQLTALQSELTSTQQSYDEVAKALELSQASQHKAEQQLEHQTADSKNVLLALKKEVEKCQDLQSQNSSLKEQLVSLQSGLSADSEKLNEELLVARQRLGDVQQQVLSLSSELKDMNDANAQLRTESAAHQTELGHLKTQITSVKEEILSLTVNLEQSKAAQQAAEQKCHHLETESHNVLVALKKEVEKCQDLQNQNHDLKEQLSHAIVPEAPVAAAAPVIVEDTARVTELQAKVESLQTDLQTVTNQLTEETAKSSQFQAEAKSLLAQGEQKSKQIEDLMKQLQEQAMYSEMSLKSAQEAKTAAEAEVAAVKNSGAEMGSQFGALKQQIQKLETENRQLHQVIAQLRQVRKTNKGEEENMLVERDELRAQNANLQAEVSRLDKLASVSASNAEQVNKFRAELNASLNKSLYLEQALDETKRQLATLERDHYNKTSQLDIVSSDLMLAKQDLELSQLEVRNLKDAMSLIQVEQQNESSRLHHELEIRTKQLHSQFDHKQKELLEEYERKYDECLQRCQVAEQQCQDEQLFRRRAELDFNNEKKKVQKTLESALQQLNNTQQDVVDRMLISNLIVSYFKKRRSMEVMELIAKVLQFNEEQKVVVGLKVAPVNLISSIFATVIGSAPAATAPTEVEGENLAEQWINFLITEAENGKAPPK